jgi:putative oxidoreductase
MTLTIQIFVFPDAWWTVHVYWATLFILIMARGAGAISVDHLIRRRYA